MYLNSNQQRIRPLLCRKFAKMIKMSMRSDPVSDQDPDLHSRFCLPNCIMVGSRMNSSGRAHPVSFCRCLADRASLPWPSENGSGNANRSLNRTKKIQEMNANRQYSGRINYNKNLLESLLSNTGPLKECRKTTRSEIKCRYGILYSYQKILISPSWMLHQGTVSRDKYFSKLNQCPYLPTQC